MYCIHCGKEVPPNATYCPFCGEKVNEADESKEHVRAEWVNDDEAPKAHVSSDNVHLFSVLALCLSVLIPDLSLVFAIIALCSHPKNADKGMAISAIVIYGLYLILVTIYCVAILDGKIPLSAT